MPSNWSSGPAGTIVPGAPIRVTQYGDALFGCVGVPSGAAVTCSAIALQVARLTGVLEPGADLVAAEEVDRGALASGIHGPVSSCESHVCWRTNSSGAVKAAAAGGAVTKSPASTARRQRRFTCRP